MPDTFIITNYESLYGSMAAREETNSHGTTRHHHRTARFARLRTRQLWASFDEGGSPDVRIICLHFACCQFPLVFY